MKILNDELKEQLDNASRECSELASWMNTRGDQPKIEKYSKIDSLKTESGINNENIDDEQYRSQE